MPPQSLMPSRYREMSEAELLRVMSLMPYRRVFVVSQTGGGKSHFIKRIWEGGPRNQLRFVFDSKGLFDIDGEARPDPLSDQRVVNGVEELAYLLKHADTDYSMVFKPPKTLIEGRAARAYADIVLGLLFDHCVGRFNDHLTGRRPWYGARVYVDELGAISTAQSAPVHWNAFASRGRALWVGLWGGTQRPVDIPGTAMSESEIKLVGHLETETDLDTVAKKMGCPLFRVSPQEIAEQLGAKEGDPSWYSFWLKYRRTIRLVNV